MSVMKFLLFSLGVLILLGGVCLSAVWLERRFPGKRFDERQKIARGNAYRLASWVGNVYFLVILAIMLRWPDLSRYVEPYLLIFLGLELEVMVMHIYCIITHASLPLSEKPGMAVGSYLFIGALYLTMIDFSQPLKLVGYGSNRVTWLSLGVSFLALAAMHILSLLHREKE